MRVSYNAQNHIQEPTFSDEVSFQGSRFDLPHLVEGGEARPLNFDTARSPHRASTEAGSSNHETNLSPGRIMICDVDCQVRERCEQWRVILDQLADSPQVPVSMQDVQSQLRDERAVYGNMMDDIDKQLQCERRES